MQAPGGSDGACEPAKPPRRQPAGALTVESPIDPLLFRTVLGHFGSGVVVISAVGARGPVGMSCQSFFSVSLDPPLIAVSPARTSTTWPHIAQVGHFAVSILSRDQEKLCRSFAVSGGDKFVGVEWEPARRTGAPVLAGALAWLDCRVEDIHEAGDHFLVVARVMDLEAGGGEPLMFYRGGFGSFLDRVDPSAE